MVAALSFRASFLYYVPSWVNRLQPDHHCLAMRSSVDSYILSREKVFAVPEVFCIVLVFLSQTLGF